MNRVGPLYVSCGIEFVDLAEALSRRKSSEQFFDLGRFCIRILKHRLMTNRQDCSSVDQHYVVRVEATFRRLSFVRSKSYKKGWGIAAERTSYEFRARTSRRTDRIQTDRRQMKTFRLLSHAESLASHVEDSLNLPYHAPIHAAVLHRHK